MRTEEKIMQALKYVESNILSKKTNMIYDHNINTNPGQWPTYDECLASFPNPCGYGTGMEDGMISGGTMVDGCMLLYEKTGSPEAAGLTRRLISGMLNAADTAKSPGFIPRAVSPSDGVSHYIDTSVDQYTLFVFGMHRYYNSALCTADEKERIKGIAVKIADRAERNVTPDNNYDMLREDGGPTISAKLWGSEPGNHAMLRLPMIYLFAWEVSGDEHYLDLYRGIRREGIEKSLPMTEYGHYYTLQQMQASARLCYDVDPDAEWRERILELMREVSKYILTKVDTLASELKDKSAYNVKQKPFRECEMRTNKFHEALGMPCESPYREDAKDFWTLQDMAIVTIVTCLMPGAEIDESATALLDKAFDKIDFKTHQRALPVHFFNAYCNLLGRRKLKE